MKKTILCLLLIAATSAAFGQPIDTMPERNKDFYLKKSKNQKTTAWILLGVGTTLVAVAAPGNISFDILPVMVGGASACIIGSIPLFIASARNKRKAMSLSLKLEHSPQWRQKGLTTSPAPSINLKINL